MTHSGLKLGVFLLSSLLAVAGAPGSSAAEKHSLYTAPPPIIDPYGGRPERFKILRYLKPLELCANARSARNDLRVVPDSLTWTPSLEGATGIICENYTVTCDGISGVSHRDYGTLCYEIEALP
jgi:hypothetical protein